MYFSHLHSSKFFFRKHWVITGSDDMQVRVFNYNTLERIHSFEAHSDYIRSIAVHPTQSFVLTCRYSRFWWYIASIMAHWSFCSTPTALLFPSSDDMHIKLWDWDKKWTCTQVFEGHTHYVMQVRWLLHLIVCSAQYNSWLDVVSPYCVNIYVTFIRCRSCSIPKTTTPLPRHLSTGSSRCGSWGLRNPTLPSKVTRKASIVWNITRAGRNRTSSPGRMTEPSRFGTIKTKLASRWTHFYFKN